MVEYLFPALAYSIYFIVVLFLYNKSCINIVFDFVEAVMIAYVMY